VTILKGLMHFIKINSVTPFLSSVVAVFEFDLCAFLTDREAVRKAAAAGVRALADLGKGELDRFLTLPYDNCM
jgi:hypothetical protein